MRKWYQPGSFMYFKAKAQKRVSPCQQTSICLHALQLCLWVRKLAAVPTICKATAPDLAKTNWLQPANFKWKRSASALLQTLLSVYFGPILLQLTVPKLSTTVVFFLLSV